MLPRRGSRRIEVEGHALLWWVRRRGARGCPDCDECIVVLAHASRTGSFVRVGVPDAWHTEVLPITPARIAGLVQKALRRGWLPGQGSGEFDGGLGELPPPLG